MPTFTWKTRKLDIRKHSEKNWGGGHQNQFPGISRSLFTACESPLTHGEYRASSTSKRGTVDLMNHAGDQVPIKPYKELRTAGGVLQDF